MRTRARRDNNETELKQQLQDLGFAVAEISSPAIPDLLVFHPNYGMWLLEVKGKWGKLTPTQAAFHEKFKGANIIIARDIDQVLRDMGVSS